MKRRVITGVLVAIGWVLVLRYLPGAALFPVLVACALACQWEFYRLVERGGHPVNRVYGMIWGALWLVAGFAFPPGVAAGAVSPHVISGLVLAGGGFALFLMLLFNARARQPMDSAAWTVLGFFYAPVMLSFYLRLAQWGVTRPFEISREGVFIAFFLSAIVKFGDAGAYGVGIAFGRHKLFPRISPGKSWEGLAGGLAASVLTSMLIVRALHTWPSLPGGPLSSLSMAGAAAVGMALGVTGTLGDLVESMFKRAAGTKDSSGILPGMGGILDVFDSLIFTPALMYALLIGCLA